jgi:hypothetical protein
VTSYADFLVEVLGSGRKERITKYIPVHGPVESGEDHSIKTP